MRSDSNQCTSCCPDLQEQVPASSKTAVAITSTVYGRAVSRLATCSWAVSGLLVSGTAQAALAAPEASPVAAPTSTPDAGQPLVDPVQPSSEGSQATSGAGAPDAPAAPPTPQPEPAVAPVEPPTSEPVAAPAAPEPTDPAAIAPSAGASGFSVTPSTSAVSDPWGHPPNHAAGQLLDPFGRPVRPTAAYPSSWVAPIAPPEPAFEPLPAYDPYARPAKPRAESIHPRISGYGGISLRSSSVSRKLALLSGTRGGVILGRFSLGGAFYRMQHRFAPPILGPGGRELELNLAYGGLTLGVHVLRGRIVDLGFGALVGAGLGCVGDGDDRRWRCVDRVQMFVAEPEAALYLKVTRWMRVRLAAGYRFVRRQPWRAPNDFTLAGGYGEIGAEFGWFRNQ